jgi:secreted PhoX family phosphatase
MAHEASTVVHNKGGKVVVYRGDDDYFEYTYKFVSKLAFDPASPESGKNILDDGVLPVAKVNADDVMNGVPRVHGIGPLTAEKGFASQANALLKTRLAADAVGATPMDRPEDMQTKPATGRVYAIMTKNNKMTADRLNRANTRPENLYGT